MTPAEPDERVRGYLARLGLRAEAPTDDFLRRLHVRHLERVPFENLDIHRGVPIVLDEDALVAKVLSGRGGFCYELNGAFAWLLARLGFAVERLEARVVRPDGSLGIRFDHLALRVGTQGSWLADVGFGDSFLEPLPLAAGAETEEGPRGFRLRASGADLRLERREDSAAWRPEYVLFLAPRSLADFSTGCEHHQASPDSTFTKGPICTRVDGGVRVTLRRDRLVHGVVTTPVRSPEEWRARLREHFGMDLDGVRGAGLPREA